MLLLRLTVASVAAPLYDGEVKLVRIPGADGEMTLMANHEPIVSTLKAGKIVAEDSEGKQHEWEITHGALELAHNHATVLL